jgi:hypothetical protein
MNTDADAGVGATERRIAHLISPQVAGFATVAFVGFLVFLLNRDPVTEQGIFLAQYRPYADYIAGDGSREVVSYPMWGYPAVIAFLGDALRMTLQYVLALTVVIMLMLRQARIKPLGLVGISIVAIASVPWFAISSLNSASAIALPLIWIAILFSLVRDDRMLGIKQALTAGLLIGLALNFRSEFLALPVVLSVWFLALPALRDRSLAQTRRSILPALALSAVAWASLLPWAAFTHAEAGEANLTSTNGGAVSYITLGQLPGNPWGIVHEDSQAQWTLSELGHTGVDPHSPEGNDILMSLFLDSIRDEPVAYARKVVHNTRNAFLGGLYFGDWEQWIPGMDAAQMDVIREKLKARIEINENQSEVARYQESGLWDEDVGLSEIAVVSVAIFLVIGTNLLILISVAVAVFVILRRRLTSDQAVPLLIFAYVLTTVALLQYQPRHMNAAWPTMIIFSYPFLTGTITWARSRLL